MELSVYRYISIDLIKDSISKPYQLKELLMSSHHVVRDQQEPAVIVASPAKSFFPKLAEMFEWSPIVIVLTEALKDFLLWDTKLDVVVGDNSIIEQFKDSLAFQEPYTRIISEDNLLEEAIQYLIDNNHKAIHIFSLKPDFALANKAIEIVFFTPTMKIVQSKTNFYSKWVAKDTCFQIVSGKVDSTENLENKGNMHIAKENGFVNFFGKDEFWIGELLNF